MRWMINDRYPAMPWDQVDNVVFDVGNVLLTFDPARLLENEFPGDRALHERLMVKVFRSPYWVMQDHGTMSQEELAEAMAGLETGLLEPIRRLLAGWVDLKDVIDEGLFALNACRAHGKRTYVLSNYGDEPFAHVDAKHAFFRGFDGKIISSRVHLLKPDPRIYRLLIRTYALDPARTLFIDDAPANIETALEEGWQGLCYSEPGLLYRFFG